MEEWRSSKHLINPKVGVLVDSSMRNTNWEASKNQWQESDQIGCLCAGSRLDRENERLNAFFPTIRNKQLCLLLPLLLKYCLKCSKAGKGNRR